MRTTARYRAMGLGVGLLLLAGLDVSAGLAADRSGTPWLGVYSQSLTSELREGIDYNGRGVIVNRVVPGSPADRAGLQSGDVIVRLDSRDVDSPEELAQAVRNENVG